MSLSAKDQVGSRIRCLHLSKMIKENPNYLTELIALPKYVQVPPNPSIIPCGIGQPDELIFNKPISQSFIDELISLNPRIRCDSYDKFKKEVESWWLKHPKNANTPNWDIACIAKIDGEYGLILVEAKAHQDELNRNRKNKSTGTINSKENTARIGEAIAEASKKLSIVKRLEFNLSLNSPYQLSNRFAWSWKLASMNIPVVLVYLGFTNASEMRYKLFENHQDVVDGVKKICRESKKADSNVYVPEAVWSDTPIKVNGGANMYTIIRSMELMIGEATIKSINGKD